MLYGRPIHYFTFFGKFLSDFKLEKQTTNQNSIFDECVGVLSQYLIKVSYNLFLFNNLATTLQINYTSIHLKNLAFTYYYVLIFFSLIKLFIKVGTYDIHRKTKWTRWLRLFFKIWLRFLQRILEFRDVCLRSNWWCTWYGEKGLE